MAAPDAIATMMASKRCGVWPGAQMDGEHFDRWTRGMEARLARRGLIRALAAGIATVGLATAADAKKKKKKKKGPVPAGCVAPNVACGAACCPPGEPCVNGRCGCGAGEVFCDVGSASGCVPGSCCPEGVCTDETCCPAGTACLFLRGGAYACECITGQDTCAGRCCPTGQACYDEVCGPCRPGTGVTPCGPFCACVTSIENTAACVDATLEVDCQECEDDAACTAQLGKPALCVARTVSGQCPSGRFCVPAGCPNQ